MNKGKLPFVFIMVCVGVLLMISLFVIGLFGAMDITDGCLYRYSIADDESLSASDKVTNTVTLNATANYTVLETDGSGGFELDPNAYGKWLNTNLRVTEGQKIKYNIQGTMSLCKAYVPTNNLQQSSNLDSNGDFVEIPRTEDLSATPVTLYVDAQTGAWRNLAEVFQNDHLVVSILPDQKTTAATVSVYNSFEGIKTADCREGSTTYSPICGRFTLWDGSYVSNCTSETYQCNCNTRCTKRTLGVCVREERTCQTCIRYLDVNGTAPEPYENNGTYTSPWRDDIADLMTDFKPSCSSDSSYIMGDYQDEKYFWFSADNAAGLLYRFASGVNSGGGVGSNYEIAEIDSDQSFYTQGENYKIILNKVQGDTGVKYLQYRVYDNDSYSNNTGGYVLNIKQTKCRRSNGNSFDDTVSGRGAVQYVIANYGNNPNTTSTTSVDSLLVDASGDGSIIAPSGADGYLWLKVKNAEEDYQNSTGQYTVSFYTSVTRGWFDDVILEPFFNGLKGKIKDTATTIFKNMTCYKGLNDSGVGCQSFFSYIKAMLMIYIILYGMMFLMGMVKLTQTDLVIRVIKIGVVAGLMNDTTFEFFSSYVFGFVTNFSDEIIANMSGYSMFSGSTSVSNPFVFLREVMTKIFLSSTFAAQLMALLSMGLNGIFYFIIVFLCLCIVVVVTFKAIAVYMMAFMAITVLIGIAPLFLTFILFERTKYLFDNWVKFTIRYMLEPVIVLAGIIILTQLFTIYLDYVIGYSVCWKCALAFKLPFPQIDGITPAFLDVPLFCIYWFAPWGFDGSSGEMGLSMQNFIVLLMLAYCMWGYIDFAHQLVARLAGGAGGPSAVHMGRSMSGALGDRALKKIGMDANSRQKMLDGIKKMRASMRTGKKINPRDMYNRHDKGMVSGDDKIKASLASRALGGASQAAGQVASQAKKAMSAAKNAAKKSWGGLLPSKKADNKADNKDKEEVNAKTDASKTDNSKAQTKSSRTANLSASSQMLSGSKKQKAEGDEDKKDAKVTRADANAKADDKDSSTLAASKTDAKKDVKTSRSDADTKADDKDSAALAASKTDADKGAKAQQKKDVEKADKQDAVIADESGASAESKDDKAGQTKRLDTTSDAISAEQSPSKETGGEEPRSEEAKTDAKQDQAPSDQKSKLTTEPQKDAKTKTGDESGSGDNNASLTKENPESDKIQRAGGESAGGLEQRERSLGKEFTPEDLGSSSDEAAPKEDRGRIDSQEFDPSDLEEKGTRGRLDSQEFTPEDLGSSSDEAAPKEDRGRINSQEFDPSDLGRDSTEAPRKSRGRIESKEYDREDLQSDDAPKKSSDDKKAKGKKGSKK